MRVDITYKNGIVTIISYLYILLFVYAAMSKLLDFENFRVQIGQSPMLSSHAELVVWFVPFFELAIAILLLIPRMRLFGILSSYYLMLLFSAYIFATINFSDYVPCSCGGILEELTWHQHLVFNLFFCALAGIAILLYKPEAAHGFALKLSTSILILSGLSSVAILTVVLLFQNQVSLSRDDSFSRIFEQHLYVKIAEKKLKYHGYYFAGEANDTLYLGNSSSPLSILAVDSTLNTIHNYNIKLDNLELPFRKVILRISPPYFYLTDGTIPAIFSGALTDWNATQVKGIKSRFSAIEIADSTIILFRGKSTKNRETILGSFSHLSDKWNINYNDNLLQKQVDGVFDSDGMMHYNRKLNALIYLYYYRNQYVVADKNLNLLFRAHTIDTNTQAKIKVAKLPEGQKKLLGPSQIINNYSCTAEDLIFINSNLRNSSETVKERRKSAIVDVYNLTTKEYEHSFHVLMNEGKKLQGMHATPTRIYFLIDDLLVSYHYSANKSTR